MMDVEALKGYVGMMQLALDKIHELIEENEQVAICQHPLGARRDLSTMGHQMWECKLCGYTFEEQAEESGNG